MAEATQPADEQKPEATKPADTKPVSVKFGKAWGIYNKDEIAGFSADKADWLVSKKIAVKA